MLHTLSQKRTQWLGACTCLPDDLVGEEEVLESHPTAVWDLGLSGLPYGVWEERVPVRQLLFVCEHLQGQVYVYGAVFCLHQVLLIPSSLV
jgi:hypothetical protein